MFTLHTVKENGWNVLVLMNNDQLAKVDNVQYASEAGATLAAIQMKREKPFMNYVVRKA